MTWVIGLVAVVLLVILVFINIKRGNLKEKYAVLWLAVSVSSIFAIAIPQFIPFLANNLGFTLPANFVFVVTVGTALLLTFLLSTDISKKQKQLEVLASEIAILKNKINKD
ncbi:MAG: DUF2304 domain-containing protein [Candidatus Nanopelagicales bacterium]